MINRSVFIRALMISSVLCTLLCCAQKHAVSRESPAKIPTRPIPWKAKWIAASEIQDTINTWTVFRTIQRLQKKPETPVWARIAVDSKYWLWINERLVVFEGGLKRGPNPDDTYYDEVDVSKYLTKGENTLAVLVWYFGKNGFSHNSSGRAGLLFQAKGGDLQIFSDASWKAWQHPAFEETGPPHPNFRLPESNIGFNAQKGDMAFLEKEYDDAERPGATVLGQAGAPPWNKLEKRPIPQWKDYGLKPYLEAPSFPFVATGDTIKVRLPYNAQITPFFKIRATGGQKLDIRTDHYYGGGTPNVRAEYTSRSGVQTYESLGWMNGHEVHYHIPEGIQVLDLAYRETGYDTEFTGSFECDDEFYNRLWQKSLRTLYVTMRDTYMDCPDRERAQWWGDEVLESGEAFYALSPSSHALVRKGMLELMNWQKQDSTIFSPVPAGNWDKELPTQMLSSIGTYGFWNYYWNTGDKKTIATVYSAVRDYLSVWKLNEEGLVQLRKGGWTWGDWGENKDMPLLFQTQYYMALDSYRRMSELLGETEEVVSIKARMRQFKSAFNRTFWNGKAYRSKDYKGKTDDRSQGLAVVAGLADPEKFPAIYEVLKVERHASPYMEKYILEALFQMGYADFALERMRLRFQTMVDHPTLTTLWEGWGIGAAGYGGGTVNHAWSGGGLTLLSQYVAGVAPTSAGYATFEIRPRLGFLKRVKAEVPSIKGIIRVAITVGESYKVALEVPPDTRAKVVVPSRYTQLFLNGKKMVSEEGNTNQEIIVPPGTHLLIANEP